MTESSIIFHIHLIQDVAVLRPLMFLAKTIPGRRIEVLVAKEFAALDNDGFWARETDALCAELDIPLHRYQSELDALLFLAGKHGVVIAGSESTVVNHRMTHNLFRALPAAFTSITLQHGFECVGFLHSAGHDDRVGRSVRFAADIIVGWFARERLRSVVASEVPKLYIAGPPSLVALTAARPVDEAVDSDRTEDEDGVEGIVFENLHSVRFGASARSDFLDSFTVFAASVAERKARVYLRPHPSGRYTEIKKIALPDGAVRSFEPLYRVALKRLAYAISAPSTVVLDCVLAGIPTALWCDEAGTMDVSNYVGLTIVRSPADCIEFARTAHRRAAALKLTQDRFVARLGIPKDVTGRYLSLLAGF